MAMPAATKRAIIGTIFMSALLLLYMAMTFQLGIVLLGTGEPVAMAMGVALFVLPAIGVWALIRELLFGIHSGKLVSILEAEGALPEDSFDHLPSGRPVRADADAVFPAYALAVENDPSSWRAWLRLGLIYDAAGDRRRARRAVREAIKLSRADNGGRPAR